MSVTMTNGLVKRHTLDRKSDTNLPVKAHKLASSGDIAYNMMRMWQGALGLAVEDCIVSPAYVVLAPTEEVDSVFAVHWFKSARMLYLFWAYSYGLTDDRLRLYFKDFARIRVSIPSIGEQRRIGQILSTWDQAIGQTKKLIEAKQKLKRGLMQQLLTGKRRFPGFEKQWHEIHLGQVALVNPPRAAVKSDSDEVTFLSMSDLADGGGVSTRQLRPYGEVKNGYTFFAERDVLVAKITPCFENGKGALATGLKHGRGYGSTEFHVLRASGNLHPGFLFRLTMSHTFRKRGIANMTGSAGQKRVPADFLRSYEIALPSMAEQERIDTTLRAIDLQTHLLQTSISKLTTQKRGLMQRLLTGQVRVKT